jgi:hypothetical protein
MHYLLLSTAKLVAGKRTDTRNTEEVQKKQRVQTKEHTILTLMRVIAIFYSYVL